MANRGGGPIEDRRSNGQRQKSGGAIRRPSGDDEASRGVLPHAPLLRSRPGILCGQSPSRENKRVRPPRRGRTRRRPTVLMANDLLTAALSGQDTRPGDSGQRPSRKGETSMYVFARTLQVHGADIRGALTWATTITERVTQTNRHPGVAVVPGVQPGASERWRGPASPPTTPPSRLSSDKLMVDDGYLDLVSQGHKHIIQGTVDDTVSQIMHPAEAPTTPITADYAGVIRTTCANGCLAEGLALGVELAQRVTELTGLRCSFPRRHRRDIRGRQLGHAVPDRGRHRSGQSGPVHRRRVHRDDRPEGRPGLYRRSERQHGADLPAPRLVRVPLAAGCSIGERPAAGQSADARQPVAPAAADHHDRPGRGQTEQRHEKSYGAPRAPCRRRGRSAGRYRRRRSTRPRSERCRSTGTGPRTSRPYYRSSARPRPGSSG